MARNNYCERFAKMSRLAVALAFLGGGGKPEPMGDPARILFFGRLADLAGLRERAMTLPGPTPLSAIIATLTAESSELGRALAARNVRVVVNREITRDLAAQAGPGDEIAFLPPVSGG
jgi:molybdopterin synthase sulfur carrier subunit